MEGERDLPRRSLLHHIDGVTPTVFLVCVRALVLSAVWKGITDGGRGWLG
jgi:hypothetical protein